MLFTVTPELKTKVALEHLIITTPDPPAAPAVELPDPPPPEPVFIAPAVGPLLLVPPFPPMLDPPAPPLDEPDAPPPPPPA